MIKDKIHTYRKETIRKMLIKLKINHIFNPHFVQGTFYLIFCHGSLFRPPKILKNRKDLSTSHILSFTHRRRRWLDKPPVQSISAHAGSIWKWRIHASLLLLLSQSTLRLFLSLLQTLFLPLHPHPKTSLSPCSHSFLGKIHQLSSFILFSLL